MKRGWEIKKLSELFTIKPPKKLAKEKLDDEDEISFVPMACLNIEDRDLSLKQSKQLKDAYKGYTYFADNDVLLAKITPCFENGKVGIAKGLLNGIGSSEFIVFRPNGHIVPEYLYYYLSQESFRDEGKNRMAGAVGHKRVSKEFIEEYLLPFPKSTEEQNRIVAILDKAFTAIDKAKANAEKNLANAKELFESYLNGIFENPGEDWEEKVIDEIAVVKGGKRVPKGYKLETSRTEHPYITVADFTDDGTVDTNNLKYISSNVFKQIKRYTITNNDLYISIAGTIGKTGIIPKELNGANLTENACKLILKDGLNKYFLYYFTITAGFIRQAGLNTRIAAQPKLALKRLKTIKISIPSLKEQSVIIGDIQNFQTESKKLEKIYQQKINTLGELKKSILKKAFGGEL